MYPDVELTVSRERNTLDTYNEIQKDDFLPLLK